MRKDELPVQRALVRGVWLCNGQKFRINRFSIKQAVTVIHTWHVIRLQIILWKKLDNLLPRILSYPSLRSERERDGWKREPRNEVGNWISFDGFLGYDYGLLLELVPWDMLKCIKKRPTRIKKTLKNLKRNRPYYTCHLPYYTCHAVLTCNEIIKKPGSSNVAVWPIGRDWGRLVPKIGSRGMPSHGFSVPQPTWHRNLLSLLALQIHINSDWIGVWNWGVWNQSRESSRAKENYWLTLMLTVPGQPFFCFYLVMNCVTSGMTPKWLRFKMPPVSWSDL